MNYSSLYREITEENLRYWEEEVRSAGSDLVPLWLEQRGKMLRAVQEGLRFAETQERAAAFLLGLWDIIESQGDWQRCEHFYENARRVLAPDAGELRLHILNRLGFIQMLQMKTNEALALHQESYEEAQKGFSEVLGESALGMGSAYYYKREYKTAEQWIRQAIEAFSSGKKVRAFAAALTMAGMIAQGQGDYRKAEKNFKEAFSLRKNLHVDYDTLRAVNNLAHVLDAQGKDAEALAVLQEGETFLSENRDNLNETNFLLTRGTLYSHQGKHQEAEFTFQAINQTYLRKHGHLLELGMVLNNLGTVKQDQGQHDEAVSYFQDCFEIFQQINNELHLANSLGALAKSLVVLNRNQEAISLCDQAIQLLTKFSENAWARGRRQRLIDQRNLIKEA
jgi:tetratricopeptide (TPR) repeat protein